MNLTSEPFDLNLRTRIVFGAGMIARLGELVRELGGSRVMLVSDPGIVAAGYDERAAQVIKEAQAESFLFDRVGENPTTSHVEAAAAFGRECKADLIVGLGGGSSMDCAKGANFLLTNGGRMQDYWGVDKAKLPMLPMIAIPTTAGTGSEVQSFALISDQATHVKMACGDKKAAPRIALLDPELTISQPASVAAITGMDALSHAIESYVTTRRNPVSRFFARRAWELMSPTYPGIFEAPTDVDMRSRMLLGACFAGLAIENSMLGAAHSCANPLTAHFGITHGIAIGLMLPHVIRFNGAAVDELYGDLLKSLAQQSKATNTNGLKLNGNRPSESLAQLAEHYRATANLPGNLGELGVRRSEIESLARDAAQQWTANFNPRPVCEADFLRLYEMALG